jgi:hypothetical protein
MASLTGGFKTAALTTLPLDGARTIVDVGGADGTVLAAILAAHPDMRGVLFDLPHVITDAPQVLARHGVDDRVECVGGDFLHSVPSDADVYLASLVLPTGRTRRPGASWPASPRPAAAARDCYCSSSWCRQATPPTCPRSPT